MKVLFGDVAVLTARPFSELAITEEPNGILTTLNIGVVAVDVKEAGLKPGEFNEIRTPHAAVRMRGSRVEVGVRVTGHASIVCPEKSSSPSTTNRLPSARPAMGSSSGRNPEHQHREQEAVPGAGRENRAAGVGSCGRGGRAAMSLANIRRWSRADSSLQRLRVFGS